MSTPELPPQSTNLTEILGFLHGECELDGHWFGDVTVNRPRYWWRAKLREAIHADRLVAYRAGRLTGLEEGAKVCDAVYAEEQQEPVCYGFASECATAIRALKEKQE